MKVVEYGHELVVLANLMPVHPEVVEADSWMIQTVGHEVVHCLSDCLGLPMVRRKTEAKSFQRGLGYEPASGDEVEDLYRLLLDVKRHFPEVNAVASGAIFSNYQRHRVENVCQRLGLTSISYLWRREQGNLLREMISNQVDAVLLKVASLGLTRGAFRILIYNT